MITKDIRIRITYKDWKRLRDMFPAKRGESAAKYIARVIDGWEKNDVIEYLNERRYKII